MSERTAIERAFDLARTGSYIRIAEIRDVLDAEGYTTAQLVGPALVRQIRELCEAANGREPAHRRRRRAPSSTRLSYFRKLNS